MEKNTLVTKLKGSVSLDLPRLGELMLHIGNESVQQGGSNTLQIQMVSGQESVIRVDGTGSFGTTNGSYIYNKSNHYTLSSNSLTTLYFNSGEYNVYIGNKDNISQIRLGVADQDMKSIVSMNLLDCRYLSSLVQLRLTNSLSVGNVDNCLDNSILQNLLKIYFTQSPGITGNFSTLGNFNLTEIDLRSSGVTGTVEGFVAAQVARGKTTSSQITVVPITLGYSLRNITFGGLNIQTKTSLIWEDSGAKIALYGGDDASASTVYVKGYGTQEQAEAAFPGKTVVRVDA